MTRIIQPGRNAWTQVQADASGVIVDAADHYHTFYEVAGRARRSILISGWQFDRNVALVRGPDAPPGAEVRFLKYLDGLCQQKAELHIYILAWDFHMVFAHEREWMQQVFFHWMTHGHFQFRFDDCPAAGGSHHQKFVVVDGELAFLGGMDICESRWDDRRHLAGRSPSGQDPRAAPAGGGRDRACSRPVLLPVRGRERDLPCHVRPIEGDDRGRPVPHGRVGQLHQPQLGNRQRAPRVMGGIRRGGKSAYLARAIRRVRVSLLAELAGLSGLRDIRSLVACEGPRGTARRDFEGPGARLQRHGPPTEGQAAAMEPVDPDDLPFDPETSDEDNSAAREEPTDESRRR